MAKAHRKTAVAPDPLDIPDFLRISLADRRKAWLSYTPPAAIVAATMEERASFARLAEQRKVEQRARLVRVAERARQRRAVPDRVAADWRLRADSNNRMTAATFNRILRELPTKSMQSILKDTWVQDGKGYRRAVVHVAGLVIKHKATTKTARPVEQTARPVAVSDDFAQQLTDVIYVKGVLDRARLEQLAKRNGAWKDSYDALDNGRARMTVSNILRNRIKRGEQVKWS